jgi:hypothetical protein
MSYYYYYSSYLGATPSIPSAPSPSTLSPPTYGELNGEEACEEHGYNQDECVAVGNGNCCEWEDGECWAAIGPQICPGKSTHRVYKFVFFLQYANSILLDSILKAHEDVECLRLVTIFVYKSGYDR